MQHAAGNNRSFYATFDVLGIYNYKPLTTVFTHMYQIIRILAPKRNLRNLYTQIVLAQSLGKRHSHLH